MNQLKTLRKQRNISQADIANELGIKPAAVSKYETGRVPLSEDSIEKLCEILKVSADELLGLSNTSPISSKAAGQIYPASVTLEDYLLTLLNTIAKQKKQMDQTIRNLHLCGIPTTTIARVTAMSETEIQKLLD
ncbi:hypothetical protein C823_005332 [Eubacterium plexicaudatum ASF492]|uniref:HTH cro/C1-type domain-containing protein n=1 Tax=Eubacterium plexicaudatum ASF492 TaxID=1235802 RepID=N2B5T4_9FIRM|nr:hypothetical protein C823_005332 [Eubacterium plexicaudatum ASF492]